MYFHLLILNWESTLQQHRDFKLRHKRIPPDNRPTQMHTTENLYLFVIYREGFNTNTRNRKHNCCQHCFSLYGRLRTGHNTPCL